MKNYKEVSFIYDAVLAHLSMMRVFATDPTVSDDLRLEYQRKMKSIFDFLLDTLGIGCLVKKD